MGEHEDKGAKLFSVLHADRTSGNGQNLQHMKYHLTTCKNFSTVRVVKHWSRFPRQAVESPSLHIFKTQQHMVLSNPL